MKENKVEKLYANAMEEYIKLIDIATSKGYLFEQDIEGILFNLFLDDNENELTLMIDRIKSAADRMKSGRFKFEKDEILGKKVA